MYDYICNICILSLHTHTHTSQASNDSGYVAKDDLEFLVLLLLLSVLITGLHHYVLFVWF